ncbi:16S rRNA (guanine(966)-N(2))-methyltransferase RsmD [Candidatus Pseudothioglobus singularis]|nr:16S rRNA (guanine(966)-N(2))-methyltransferase RsmD [Candidatus Pseudothioglobus singularis]MDB4822557.1 16S rRNA (guanine(966)-N(2))-methyltransferase RsmD [Candidatus Pseudothioglobus singularis]
MKNTIKSNTFKIISGDLKGRKFFFPDSTGLRPTSGKTRETLFNWLQFDIAGKTVLDPFSGTGALGIEAISRGAKKTFLIEKNIKVFRSLKSNLELIGSSKFELVNKDAIKYLKKLEHEAFDYIFLDPPFKQQILPLILNLLYERKLIHTNSQIYIESEFQVTKEFLGNNCDYECKIDKEKKSGNVYFCLISLGVV